MHTVGISAALDWRERFRDGLLNTGQQLLLVGGDTLHPALGQEHCTAGYCSRIFHINYIHIYNNLPFPTSFHRTFIWLILRSTGPRQSQTWKSYWRGIGKSLKIWGLQLENIKRWELTRYPVTVPVAGEVQAAVHHVQGHVEAGPLLLRQAGRRGRQEARQALAGRGHVVTAGTIG